ncbi:IclR family transcriptional regulator [Marivivens marinus]|uniref:IclR family transcriptional regulator n=1 Tax=Marivivens marinus TaxID=3110173 RepID=UPI003B846591
MEKRSRGRPRSAFTESTAPTLQALDRALLVLEHLARAEDRTLTGISEALDIPAPTTHRILTTLQNRGFAAFDNAAQTWAVGIEAYRTGSAYLRRTTLLDAARPVMRHLMEATGETANLAVQDGTEVVFVGQVESRNPIRAFFHPGTRTAMHASGTGKAILAALPRDRRDRLIGSMQLTAFTGSTLSHRPVLEADLDKTAARGWSFDREERHIGMSCMGAAIRDARGEVVGGISISGPSARFTEARLAAFGAEVARAAAEISAAIGATAAPDTAGS